MSEAFAPSLPPSIVAAYAKAQARLRQSAAAGYSDQYRFLMELVEQAKQWGGHYATDALAACEAIAVADEAALTRMVQRRRVAPDTPTYEESATLRQASALLVKEQNAAMGALTSRPRMSLAEQVATLEGRGFRFSVHRNDLRVAAPPGVMTDSDRTLIRNNKAAIVAHMAADAEVF
jgi:hypothetical protein